MVLTGINRYFAKIKINLAKPFSQQKMRKIVKLKILLYQLRFYQIS